MIIANATILATSAQSQSIDYRTLSSFQVHQEVQSELCFEKRNLVDWAVELIDKDPQNEREAFTKIEVMLRVGLDEHAAKTATQLRPLFAEPSSVRTNENLLMLLGKLNHELRSFPTTIAIIETFPEHFDNLNVYLLSDRFFRHDQNFWGQEKTEQWLLKMQAKTFNKRELIPTIRKGDSRYIKHFPQIEPWYLEHKDRPETVWLTLRLQNRRSQEEKVQFLQQLEKEARQNPSDTLKMLDFIFIWQSLYLQNNSIKPDCPDLSWVIEVAKPEKTLDAYYLGIELLKARQLDSAKSMFQKAWDFFDNTERRLTHGPVQRLTLETRGRSYKNSITGLIKQCDENLKRHPSAKSSPSTPTSSSSMSMTKQTQADQPKQGEALEKVRASIKKEEESLLSQEKEKKDDPSYWASRARLYYKIPINQRTEEELNKIEEGLKKTLDLIDPRLPRKEKPRHGQQRQHILSGYISILQQQKRDSTEEVFKQLLTELEINPPESITSNLAADFLSARQYSRFLEPDEPIIWKWFKSQNAWDHSVRNLLHAIARKVHEGTELPDLFFNRGDEATEEVYAFVKRVEKLAMQGDYSRMDLCVEILLGSSPLGIEPNLKRAVLLVRERLEQGDIDFLQHTNITSNLFNAYIKRKYFEEAEELFDHDDLKLRNWTRFFQLAYAAALHNNKDVAMRNWRRSANYFLKDSHQIQLNHHFQEHGLGDFVDEYYQEVKKKLPEFTIP